MSQQDETAVDTVSRETAENAEVQLTEAQKNEALAQVVEVMPAAGAATRTPMVLDGQARVVTPFMPRDTEELMRTCDIIIRGGVVPKGFLTQGRVDKAKMAVAILSGREVGFGPMMSLRSIMIVNGMPSVWGQGAKALVHSKGQVTDYMRAWVMQSSVTLVRDKSKIPRDGEINVMWENERLAIIGKQVPLPASSVPTHQWPDDLAAFVLVGRRHVVTPYYNTFSVGDATRAKLWNNPKKLYGMYPQDMLEHRAAARCYDRGFSDHLMGLAIRELIEDREDPTNMSADDGFLRSDA